MQPDHHPDSEATCQGGGASPCQPCGACCAYSREWPRFTTETDAEIARIPPSLINASESGMRCEGERCAALLGRIGSATACSIYPARPEVCRTCVPGDDACAIAREHHGLPPIATGH